MQALDYSELPQDQEVDVPGDAVDNELEDDPDAEFGGHEGRKAMEKQLLRRLDTRMCILILIYILNYIDRNNISVARLRGFEDDLHLSGSQFNTLLSVLYIGYTLMQVPSNMLLNRISRPSIYLPGCMLAWGALSVLTGFATNFWNALLIRFSLGFVEAAFFPGALFLLSKWYRRDELGLRTALLSCGSLLSNGFGTLFARVILDFVGDAVGRAAWRWLFYIEGTLTMAVAIAAMFILPDYPATSPWLTPLERRLAMKRLEEDVGSSDDDDKNSADRFLGLKLAFTDWKVWWLAVSLALVVTSLSFNAFFPTLTETLGYSTNITLLLCAPPWLFATVVTFLLTRHSDKKGERFYHIACSIALGLVGFVIAFSTMNLPARYFSLFLMASSYAGFVTFYAWISNSIPRPTAKRAVALAFINAFAQLGNIVGSYVWPASWGPSYRNSYMIVIGTSLLSIVMCWLFRAHLHTVNQKMDQEEAEMGQVQKGFRYIL